MVMSLLSVCAIFILFNTVNPMQSAFIISFKVENQSGEDIWITPIGTRGSEGRRAHLPRYISVFPALPAIKTGSFHVQNHQTIEIKYDWDDINFSEIAIESQDGQFYQLVVDSNPTKDQYRTPESRHFIIPDFKTLDHISPAVLEAVNAPYKERVRSYLIIASIFMLIIFWRTLKEYEKLYGKFRQIGLRPFKNNSLDKEIDT